jgi:hypothetical protein
MKRLNWTMEFSWANAHTVIYGYELAVRLAKMQRERDRPIVFNRIPRSLYSEIEGSRKWQKNGKTALLQPTQNFFPHVQNRLKLKININPVFAATVTGHGKTRVFLNQFKLMEHAMFAIRETKQ